MLMMLKLLKSNLFLILANILLITSFMKTSVDSRDLLCMPGTMPSLKMKTGITLDWYKIALRRPIPWKLENLEWDFYQSFTLLVSMQITGKHANNDIIHVHVCMQHVHDVSVQSLILLHAGHFTYTMHADKWISLFYCFLQPLKLTDLKGTQRD